GSWQAGKGGASAGIVMPADPVDGRLFRQEYDAGNAEDEARVLGTHSQVTVPAGHYSHVRLTEETTPVEPRADELKFFAKGIGMVMEVGLSPEASRSVLVSMSRH